MSTHPNIEALRDMVKRDHEHFKIQSQRLHEIQHSSPEEFNNADKNALQNWDKSVIKDCNRQLLLLEEIETPTAEEREIMQELNKLIVLGDHIMERRNLVQAEIYAKLAVVEALKTPKEEADNVAHPVDAAAASTSSPEHVVPSASQVPEAAIAESSADASSRQETPSPTLSYEETDSIHEATDAAQIEDIDPKMLYEVIKAKPDAPLSEVKKAAKKAITLLHPDRNLDDPTAASKFADLQAACEVFETEETRQEFDQTGKVKKIEDLDRRLRALVVDD
ncbi:hypothetical protein Q7P37_007269 [Cladosporium fusiforme]